MLIPTIEIGNKSRRQIALDFSATNGTILYTVPVNKTCTGTFIGRPSENGSVSINDRTFWMTKSGTAATGVLPVVLVAGTVLKAKGSEGYCTFIGVEE
jgi:hypothetical protein